MRIFISLNIPDDIKQKIQIISNKLRKVFSDFSVKWENSDKFHLTLRFLGELKENEISELSEQLENVKTGFESIKLSSHGLGFFPNSRRPNVIYLGFKENGRDLDKLIELIDNVIIKFGIKPDKKFVPHLTLGRFRRDNRKRAYSIELPEIEKIDLEFNSFHLMQSKLSPKGSVYTDLKEILFTNK